MFHLPIGNHVFPVILANHEVKFLAEETRRMPKALLLEVAFPGVESQFLYSSPGVVVVAVWTGK